MSKETRVGQVLERRSNEKAPAGHQRRLKESLTGPAEKVIKKSRIEDRVELQLRIGDSTSKRIVRNGRPRQRNPR